MGGRKPRTTDSRTLFAYFSNYSDGHADTARQALRELPPDEAVAMLLSWLDADRQFRRALPLRIMLGAVAWLGVMWALGLLGFRRTFDTWYMIPVFGMMALWRSRLLRSRSYDLLVGFNDLRVIDPLVDAMRHNPPDKQRSPRVMLSRLLPTLRPTDFGLVSRASRNYLNDMLVTSLRVDFVLAILAAWEQVGDEEAIPYVNRLARGDTAAGEIRTVREAADAALPAIREAARRTSTAGILLRPAQPDGGSAPLLRPAAATAAEDTATLLRSVTE